MKQLQRIINAQATQDGAGVVISRVAGRDLNRQLDPFLLLDEIKSDEAADYIGGFPEHPHRGFETITYMRTGRMRHRDHMGNEGVIESGDVQWMTAGRGVLHSEMPEQDSGLLHGFQLWLNLPAAEKMKPAAYSDIRSREITEQRLSQEGLARVIAGELLIGDHPLCGPLPPRSTQPILVDIQLQAGEEVDIHLPEQHTALTYVYEGQTAALHSQQMGVYTGDGSLPLRAGPAGAKLLLLGGLPLAEPIAQYGPFVMNTPEQIDQALQDYSQQRLVDPQRLIV